MGPSQFICNQPGSLQLIESSDVNQFWNSGVVYCIAGPDLPQAQGNAISFMGTGYVYFDPSFLAQLDGAGMSFAPSVMVLAHEFGHEIQGRAGTRSPVDIQNELGADCYAGYFLGWLGCTNRLNMNDVVAVFGTACRGGSNLPWWAPQAHGTCEQRQAALQHGIEAFNARTPPINACTL